MPGYFEEPNKLREEDESSINTTLVLSFFVTVASCLERREAASMWILRMKRSVLYA
jgi:hypothetical protein